MLNTILVIALIILLIIALLFAVPVILLSWHSRKQPPAYALIIEKYYVCRRHRILEGGIFGKGPTEKFFDKDGKSWCWRNEWQEIDRDTFKKLATDWYGVDWSKKIPYWHDDPISEHKK